MSRREFDPAAPEWMDLDQPVSAALERDLANLATLNRLFGSHALIREFLSRWLKPGRSWRILDLATGAGDIPKVIAAFARERRIDVEIHAVDAQSSTLAIARRGAPENIHFHHADIRAFPGEREWDIVLCSLALHHFSEDDAVAVLRRAAELSRFAVLAADLRRCLPGTLGVDLLTTLWMREPMTRNDARASVRRAFSFGEFAALARRAGWGNSRHERRFCFRQILWMEHFLFPRESGGR